MLKAFAVGFICGYNTRGNEARILEVITGVAKTTIMGGSTAISLVRTAIG